MGSPVKQRICEAFDAASAYDDHAMVQRQVAAEVARRILALPPRPRVLEIGCGTGLLAAAIGGALADADWLMTDIAPAMVARSRLRFAGDPRFRFALLDGEEPEGAGGPFDLVCSSLAVQWFQRPEQSLLRLFRLLRPGGRLIFSTLVDGTFAEWRGAHEALGLAPGTPAFLAGDHLASIRPDGCAGSFEFETVRAAYPDAASFLRALRGIGAQTPNLGHRPLPPSAIRAVMRRFEEAGAVATYRVAHGCFTRPVGAS